MVHLCWQKQTLPQLQLRVLSPTSDYNLALAKAMNNHTVIWDKELTRVNSNLAQKNKKFSIYPDRFLSLIYHEQLC